MNVPTATSSFTLDVRLGEDTFSASGKPDLVLRAFEDFKRLTGHAAEAAGETVKGNAKARRHQQEKRTGDVLLQEFLAKLSLKGNAQIGAAILSWAAQHHDKDKLTSVELHELWSETEFKPPTPAANTVRDLAPAVKKGWIKKDGKGRAQTFHAPPFGQKEVAKLVSEVGG